MSNPREEARTGFAPTISEPMWLSPYESRIPVVGVRVSTEEGKEEPYIWWRNGQLESPAELDREAETLAVVSLKGKGRIAIGAPVIVNESDSATGRVVPLDIPSTYGLYVQADRRMSFGGEMMFSDLTRAEVAEFPLFQGRVAEIKTMLDAQFGQAADSLAPTQG